MNNLNSRGTWAWSPVTRVTTLGVDYSQGQAIRAEDYRTSHRSVLATAKEKLDVPRTIARHTARGRL